MNFDMPFFFFFFRIINLPLHFLRLKEISPTVFFEKYLYVRINLKIRSNLQDLIERSFVIHTPNFRFATDICKTHITYQEIIVLCTEKNSLLFPPENARSTLSLPMGKTALIWYNRSATHIEYIIY